MTAPFKLRSNTVAVIGGGPSLKGYDLARVPAHWAKIAVNNSYQLAPDADLLFFADARWYQHHHPALHRDWRGRMASTAGDHQKVPAVEVVKFGREFNAPIGLAEGPYNPNDPKSWKLAGRDSGTMAVNLAAHLGARNIILFGFDMTFEEGQSHWHADHPWPTTAQRYETMFAPILSQMSELLMSRSVRIWRATEPGLPNLPYREVSDILHDIKSGIYVR